MPVLTLRQNHVGISTPQPLEKATAKRFSISFTSAKHATIDAEITTTTTTTTPMMSAHQEKAKPQVSKLKLLVHMLKEGPANSAAPDEEDEDEEDFDPEADAPMPRRKTSYEKYLKHQVRLTQVKKYNELVEKDEVDEARRKSTDSVKSSHSGFMRLRRNRSGDKLIDVEQTGTSIKKVRFLVEVGTDITP